MHTAVEFIGRHLMITKVRGRFPHVSGTITIDEEPERSHVEVGLKVSSLDSGNVDRHGQLLGPELK
jgi:polyisoprenoid-binding protein YceI